jgi:hypothetical protein
MHEHAMLLQQLLPLTLDPSPFHKSLSPYYLSPATNWVSGKFQVACSLQVAATMQVIFTLIWTLNSGCIMIVIEMFFACLLETTALTKNELLCIEIVSPNWMKIQATLDVIQDWWSVSYNAPPSWDQSTWLRPCTMNADCRCTLYREMHEEGRKYIYRTTDVIKGRLWAAILSDMVAGKVLRELFLVSSGSLYSARSIN